MSSCSSGDSGCTEFCYLFAALWLGQAFQTLIGGLARRLRSLPAATTLPFSSSSRIASFGPPPLARARTYYGFSTGTVLAQTDCWNVEPIGGLASAKMGTATLESDTNEVEM